MISLPIEQIDFKKGRGLVPVIAQDHTTGKVLMLAYANKEAVTETLRSGYATYWSRSRNRLWKKGETSGNLQSIVNVLVDCDGDGLLYVVNQQGVACHTGTSSCFFRVLSKTVEKTTSRAPQRSRTGGRKGSQSL